MRPPHPALFIFVYKREQQVFSKTVGVLFAEVPACNGELAYLAQRNMMHYDGSFTLKLWRKLYVAVD